MCENEDKKEENKAKDVEICDPFLVKVEIKLDRVTLEELNEILKDENLTLEEWITEMVMDYDS